MPQNYNAPGGPENPPPTAAESAVLPFPVRRQGEGRFQVRAFGFGSSGLGPVTDSHGMGAEALGSHEFVMHEI